MSIEGLIKAFQNCPLVASVQGSPGSPTCEPGVLLALARASEGEGVGVLRLEGEAAISLIRQHLDLPTIGLIKREYADSEVYITPTRIEVRQLIELGCEVIALDGTARARPGGESLAELIREIHQAGRLAMADCDGTESIHSALAAGADWVGTTLAGYTDSRAVTPGPDFELLRAAVRLAPNRVIAEGRFAEPWQARAARAMGAIAVVVGGALNDPVKQTRAFYSAIQPRDEAIGAVDIGGTWMRFGVFQDGAWQGEIERVALPAQQQDRLDWIEGCVRRNGIVRLGISSGGVVDPRRATVTEAKSIIPDYVGTQFAWQGVKVSALNDGLATAWGHAWHPDFAGLRVATLALGTGVGCGVVDRGRLLMGRGGGYPRLNDRWSSIGCTIESCLGGAALSPEPSREERIRATVAAREAVELVQDLYFPDVVVVCGGVGLSEWLELPGTVRSPFGANAGLQGAACLAQYSIDGFG